MEYLGELCHVDSCLGLLEMLGNAQVLSDSKDAYTDAEWVPQFVSGLLARLEPDRAKELVRPFA